MDFGSSGLHRDRLDSIEPFDATDIGDPGSKWNENIRLRTRESSVRFLKIGARIPADLPEG